MAQLDNRSDRELEDGLAKDEFAPKKAAFAKEILKRREAARGPRLVWLSGLLALLALGVTGLKRIWRKQD